MFNKRKRGVFQGLDLGAIILCCLWIGSLTLKGLYVQLSMKINLLPLFTRVNAGMLLAFMFSVMILCGIVVMVSGKGYRGVLMAVDGILTLMLLADLLYGRYYYNPITMPILKQVSFVGDIKESILSMFQPMDILMFLDFLVLLPLAWYLKGLAKGRERKPFYVQALVGLGILLLGIGGFQWKYQGLDRSNYIYDRKYMARDLGLLYYHYYDVKTTLDKEAKFNPNLTQEQTDLIESLNQAKNHTPNQYTGIAKDKNLIVIQLEAFQNFLLDLEVDGEPVTPFLNQLKQDSIYMANHFIETADGNTVDAELLTNTSMYPTYGGSAYYEFPSNTYLSLPLALKAQGYHVNSFHGYRASFWNREVMHKTLGFDRFYSEDDFNLEEKVGWGISDRSFFRQSLDITLEKSQGAPFYSFMVALSSHHPYEGFYSGPYTSEGNTDMVRRYLNAGRYVDSALEDFFNYLKETGVYENTMVVIYGDHAGLFNEDAQKACELLGVPYTPYQWYKLEQVPLLIHIPGMKGKEITTVTGQSNLLPTVANLMGFDLKYTMAEDVLSPNYQGSSMRRSGNIATDEYVYIASEQKVYDFNTGEELDLATYQPDITNRYQKFLAQDLIYRSDFLKRYKE